MAHVLLDRLRAKTKGTTFNRTQTMPSYPTGLINLDYYNGYILNAKDNEDNIIARQRVIGLVGGSFVTIIGKSGVAKSTAAIQMSMNIVKPYDNGFVYHIDVEGATNMVRVGNITKEPMESLDKKYILKQDVIYIEDIYDTCQMIHDEKIQNAKDYEYDTGLVDEFGKPIIALAPTVILMDSIPTVSTKANSEDSMDGGTAPMRVAKAFAQFYRRMTPKIKQANIILIAINHINSKVEISAFSKTQPQLMYMKMDEQLPGGNAPIYYANNLLKFVSRDKFNEEDDGFDGFLVNVEFLKSRTNKAGQKTSLVYQHNNGFDAFRSMLQIGIEHKILNGRNPYRYLNRDEHAKFSTKKFDIQVRQDPEIQKSLMNNIMPILERQISDVYGEEDAPSMEGMLETLSNLQQAYLEDAEFEKLEEAKTEEEQVA